MKRDLANSDDARAQESNCSLSLTSIVFLIIGLILSHDNIFDLASIDALFLSHMY